VVYSQQKGGVIAITRMGNSYHWHFLQMKCLWPWALPHNSWPHFPNTWHSSESPLPEVLTCLPPLDLVVGGEARAAAHQLSSLGCWSYLHPDHGHSAISKQLKKLDPDLVWGTILWGQHITFNPSIGLIYWLEKTGLKDPGPHLWLKGSSGTQMGPEHWGGGGSWGQSLWEILG
jgi:hypothetical protein